jgi:NADP-dependent 3-hydroxy acid dehydrogenase YdfG
MKYNKFLVVGAHSSIASAVLPKLDFDKNSIFAMSRTPIKKDLTWLHSDNVFVSDYPINDEFRKYILSKIVTKITDNVLVINFAGYFGSPLSLKELDLEQTVKVLNENVIQFMSVLKFFLELPKNSFLLGFSGAGVGGDHLDGSSLGYLLAKMSLAGIVEIMDHELKNESKRIALIAPGPFPSDMQSAVANAPVGTVTEKMRFQALNLKADDAKARKLADAINWVVSNPAEAGGKIWSAQRDDFLNQIFSEKFGYLRRVIQ